MAQFRPMLCEAQFSVTQYTVTTFIIYAKNPFHGASVTIGLHLPSPTSTRRMATAKNVKDVSPHEFVKAYAAHLKRSGKVSTLLDPIKFAEIG